MSNKHATLLARKCLLSPVDAEIEALLSLNLDIDWMSEGNFGQTLSETAFETIRDVTLFKKFWKAVESKYSVSPWSDSLTLSSSKKSFMALALKSRRYDLFKEWKGSYPGTEEQWQALASSPDILAIAMSTQWDDMVKKADLPPSVHDQLLAYREENLWISSRTYSDFKKNVPAKITAAQACAWLEHSKSSLHSGKENWRVGVVFEHADFQTWTDNEWERVWSAQPVGSFVLAPLRQPSNKNQSESIMPSWLKFMKAYTPNKPSVSMEKVLFDEVGSLVAQAGVYLNSYQSFQLAPSVVKTATRQFEKWMTALLPAPQDRASSNAFQYGLWHAGFQFIDAPTKTSDQAVQLFKEVNLPTSFPDLLSMVHQSVNTNIRTNRPVWTEGAFLSMLVTSLAKAHASDPHLSKFVDDMSSFPVKTLHPSATTNYALGLVASSMRLLKDKSATPELIKAAQHMFWRNVFSIPSANQHYWLKKAAAQPELSVVLDFWDASFAKRLDDAMDSRKRTSDITTMLLKLSLQNAVGSMEEKPTKKVPRKL